MVVVMVVVVEVVVVMMMAVRDAGATPVPFQSLQPYIYIVF